MGACFGFAGILPLGDLEAGEDADAIAGVDGILVRGVDAEGADVGPGVCAAGEGVDAAATWPTAAFLFEGGCWRGI